MDTMVRRVGYDFLKKRLEQNAETRAALQAESDLIMEQLSAEWLPPTGFDEKWRVMESMITEIIKWQASYLGFKGTLANCHIMLMKSSHLGTPKYDWLLVLPEETTGGVHHTVIRLTDIVGGVFSSTNQSKDFLQYLTEEKKYVKLWNLIHI